MFTSALQEYHAGYPAPLVLLLIVVLKATKIRLKVMGYVQRSEPRENVPHCYIPIENHQTLCEPARFMAEKEVIVIVPTALLASAPLLEVTTVGAIVE